MRERWPNERRSAAPNQRWLRSSSSCFLAMTSHTLLLEFAHVGALLGLGIDGRHEAAGRPSQVGALSRFMRLISPEATKDPRIAARAWQHRPQGLVASASGFGWRRAPKHAGS